MTGLKTGWDPKRESRRVLRMHMDFTWNLQTPSKKKQQNWPKKGKISNFSSKNGKKDRLEKIDKELGEK